MSHTSIASQLLAKYGQGQNGAIPRLWWMEDGATAHYSLIVRQRLHQLFHNRVVGRGHAVPWPPRSPDLTPLNVFLWGYLKDKVYETTFTGCATAEDSAGTPCTPEDKEGSECCQWNASQSYQMHCSSGASV